MELSRPDSFGQGGTVTIRDWTGSQCSSSRIADEMELNLWIWRMSRAAAFRIDCRRSSRYECTPNIALLQKSSREQTNACTKVSSALRVNEWRTTRIRRRWKKQTCESLVMWSPIDSSWSKRRPRFRVTVSDTIAAEMLESNTVSRFPSCCLVPNHRYFVLSKFRHNLFDDIQLLTASMAVLTRIASASASDELQKS